MAGATLSSLALSAAAPLHAAFPRDAVPVSGTFESGFFIPNSQHHYQVIRPPPPPPQASCLPTTLREGGQLCKRAPPLEQAHALLGTGGSASNDHGTHAFITLISLSDDDPVLAAALGSHAPGAGSRLPEAAGGCSLQPQPWSSPGSSLRSTLAPPPPFP